MSSSPANDIVHIPMRIADLPPPPNKGRPPPYDQVTINLFPNNGRLPWFPGNNTMPTTRETFDASMTVQELLTHYECPQVPGYGIREAQVMGRDHRGDGIFHRGRVWDWGEGGKRLSEVGFRVVSGGRKAGEEEEMWVVPWSGNLGAD